MEFLKKYKEKLHIFLIVGLLLLTLGVSTPLVIHNIMEAQVQAIKLESKAKAKEAWENNKENLLEGEIFYWNDGTYYWMIDFEGNIVEKK